VCVWCVLQVALGAGPAKQLLALPVTDDESRSVSQSRHEASAPRVKVLDSEETAECPGPRAALLSHDTGS
jgi:hypothetical protein